VPKGRSASAVTQVLGLAVLAAFIILGCSLFMDAGSVEPVLVSSLSVVASAIAVVDSGGELAPSVDLLDPARLLGDVGDLAALAADAAGAARDLAEGAARDLAEGADDLGAAAETGRT